MLQSNVGMQQLSKCALLVDNLDTEHLVILVYDVLTFSYMKFVSRLHVHQTFMMAYHTGVVFFLDTAACIFLIIVIDSCRYYEGFLPFLLEASNDASADVRQVCLLTSRFHYFSFVYS